jgi:hypothetical protein
MSTTTPESVAVAAGLLVAELARRLRRMDQRYGVTLSYDTGWPELEVTWKGRSSSTLGTVTTVSVTALDGSGLHWRWHDGEHFRSTPMQAAAGDAADAIIRTAFARD